MDSHLESSSRPDGLPSDNEQTQGKLKVFLGYAAGVGKTYAMLEAALLRQTEGVDVVVGLVETHGRSETDAVLANLEIVSRRSVTVRDNLQFEMDTDAILVRQPQVVVVDDLAHTNAPGSRHLHRYQNVQELLNAISHDLRTPLAAITGVLSSLHDDDALLSEAARHEMVSTAWEEARRLNRLVGNLLDMTRLESGALKVVCQPSDVEDLVGATLAQMPNRVTGRILQIEIPTGLPLIDIDFTLMVQVLVNLLDNAMKYAPPEEPITIQARQAGDEVMLTVKDRGPGLPEAELEHVFDRFFRINAEGVSGTGLGLSIAKGIVEAHNGRIWAENRQAGGAAFSLGLPIPQSD